MAEVPLSSTREKIPFTSSINFRFILIFILLVTVTTFLSGIILIYQGQRSLEDAVLKRNLTACENVRSKIENFIQGAKSSVELMTLMPGIKDLDLFQIDKMMYEVISEHERLDPVAVLNDQGIMISSRNPADQNKDMSGSDLFLKTKSKSYISDIYFSSDGQPLITIAAPIFDYDSFGRRIGVLVTAVKLRSLWPTLDGTKVGEKGMIVVTDRKGELVYRSGEVKTGNVGNDRTVKLALEGRTGSVNYGNMLSSYMPLTGMVTGSVVVKQPAREALYGVAKMRSQSMILLVLSIMVAIAIGLVLSNSMLISVRKLLVGTKIVAEGDLGYKIDIKTDDEIGELARSFNAMTVELKKQRERAITDELTHLYTHSYFLETLKAEVYRSKRYRVRLSLMMLDIDHFKSFNDNYGHQVGDEVLIKISDMLKSSLRESDVASRYGGEELVVLAAETDKEGIYILAERVRKKIAEDVIVEYEDKKLRVTVSIGVTTLTEDDIKRDIFPDDFLKRVDMALYKAKDKGRNCVVQL
ncbi:MAG: diguanylate cyclase [Candidatus Omnitrophota bacterium]